MSVSSQSRAACANRKIKDTSLRSVEERRPSIVGEEKMRRCRVGQLLLLSCHLGQAFVLHNSGATTTGSSSSLADSLQQGGRSELNSGHDLYIYSGALDIAFFSDVSS